MLTYSDSLEIAKQSIEKITESADFDTSSTLEVCGISEDFQLRVLTQYLSHSVSQSGHRISMLHLRTIDRDLKVGDVAHIIQAYSLPGDDTFEEPADPDEESD